MSQEKSLKEKILNYDRPPLLYGMTPPRAGYDSDKLKEVAAKQFDRLKTLAIDGLVLYDIQDEKSRTEVERPFPFMATLDPQSYADEYLADLTVPKIVYRCTGKYSREEFAAWLERTKSADSFSVFVGAASGKDVVSVSMQDAYEMYSRLNQDLILGGVAIPERHKLNGDEHIRMQRKQERGCKYFITQAIYNTELIKNLLSDYYYVCQETEREMVPVIFTFATCGSLKTLEFMKWLGVNIPRWLENDLLHSKDILEKSFELCIQNAKEVLLFCQAKGIPVGFNIESVSIRKAEIELSVELLNEVGKMI